MEAQLSVRHLSSNCSPMRVVSFSSADLEGDSRETEFAAVIDEVIEEMETGSRLL